MKVVSSRKCLEGQINVPGSKSHAMRALMLALLCNEKCSIKNFPESCDCLTALDALQKFGAAVNRLSDGTVEITGALEIPSKLNSPLKIDCRNSGSLLYFLSAIASLTETECIFTGDESLVKRPVKHVTEALVQLGALCFTEDSENKFCPLHVKGPVHCGTVKTAGEISSQYVTGMMMASSRLPGKTQIILSNPKETPYLFMTQSWLEKCGAGCRISDDCKLIEIDGVKKLKAFQTVIPSDWESAAFPVVAALISDSAIEITDIDTGISQGDRQIVEVLKKLGADIVLDDCKKTLTVRGGKKALNGTGRLSVAAGEKELHVNLNGMPDALCALAVAACFTEGTVIFEDLSVCRTKETDRIAVMKKELLKTGACVEEGKNFLVIHGHSPVLEDGSENKMFVLHGAEIESYGDHRVAMSFACMGFGMKENEKIIINNAECCSVSFPDFCGKMGLCSFD